MDEILTVWQPEAEYVNSDPITRLFFFVLSNVPWRTKDRWATALMKIPPLNKPYPPLPCHNH